MDDGRGTGGAAFLDGDANGHAHSHADTNGHPDSHTDANVYTDQHADTDSHAHSYADPNADGHTVGGIDSNSNSYERGHPHASTRRRSRAGRWRWLAPWRHYLVARAPNSSCWDRVRVGRVRPKLS